MQASKLITESIQQSDNVIQIINAALLDSIFIESLSFDSRTAQPGSLFIACGPSKDFERNFGQYIQQAIQRCGSKVIVYQSPELITKEQTESYPSMAFVQVRDSRKAVGQLAARFYDHPSRKLKAIGVTGTNGKTTVSNLLHGAFTNLGYKCGLMSTIHDDTGTGERLATNFTTNDAITCHRLMAEMVENGCQFCFMEASSEGILYERLEGVHFAGAIFTNLTPDHLDAHGTMKNYKDSKKRLFDSLPTTAFALVNGEDSCAADMIADTLASQKHFYSFRKEAELVRCDFDGIELQIQSFAGWPKISIKSPLIGHFNAENLLAVFRTVQLALAGDSGRNKCEQTLSEAIGRIPRIDGRMNVLKSPQRQLTIIIDYAHNPDGLKQILLTTRQCMKYAEYGRLVCLFGCGGDRDRYKRPETGRIAHEHADIVVLTEDNSRTESTASIIQQIRAGIISPLKSNIYEIANRSEAIQAAMTEIGRPGDVIVIAGKGHERYIVRGTIQQYYSDYDEVSKHA